jgi:hypothetical protein
MMRSALFLCLLCVVLLSKGAVAWAAPLAFTVTVSEAVSVDASGGTPRIALDVGGITRYAGYTGGTGTSALTFAYAPQAGDLDLDGVTLGTAIDLNGGTIRDAVGNNLSPLSFTAPDTSGVKIDYPSLAMDFIGGAYSLNGTAYGTLSSFLSAAGGTFSRSSAATYFDSSGTMQTASANTPRFDHDPATHAAKGILIEQSRTNYIRNSTMQGAVVGTPGTMPTNWTRAGGTGTGTITAHVVGSGTTGGLAYTDYRIFGTSAASGFTYYNLTFGPTAHIAASSGQTWTDSLYLALVGGTSTNITNVTQNTSLFSGGSYLGEMFSPSNRLPSLTGTLQRFALMGTISNASTTNIQPLIQINFPVSSAIDITLRIAAPQLELGTFGTSFIPTTNAAATRAADVLTVPAGTWYASAHGTLMAEYLSYTSIDQLAATLEESGTDYRAIRNNGSIYVSGLRDGGGNGDLPSHGTTVNASNTRQALTWDSTGTAGSANGGGLTTNTSTLSPSVTTLRLGGVNTGYSMTPVKSVKFYPSRAANAQLLLLTQ